MDTKSRIVTKTFVDSTVIDTLTDSDFPDSIYLDFKEPIGVCFYGEDKNSLHTLQTFVNMADEVDGFKFGVVNIDSDKKILQRFKDLDHEDHPFYWARYTHRPFILTFRCGFPQAFYNGNVDTESLKFYFENLAHVKGYKESKTFNLKVKFDKSEYLRTNFIK